MALRIKRKIFRKKIKEPDEFLLHSKKALLYFRENSKKIIVISLILFVVILSTGMFIKRFRNQKAELFNRMHNEMMLANNNFKDGQYDESEAIFGKIIQGSDQSSLFNEIAQVGLGYTFIEKKEYDRSIKLLEDLIARDKFQYPKEELYKNLVILYKKTGENDKAIEVYQKLKLLYPDTDAFISGIPEMKE